MEAVDPVRVLQLACVRLLTAAAVPPGLREVRTDHVQVESARQGPFAAATALQEVRCAAFELEEVVRWRLALARVTAPAQRAFSELPVRLLRSLSQERPGSRLSS
jgi:hypothetical protein